MKRKRKTDAILIKAPDDEMRAWREQAEREKRSLTSLVRAAMEFYLQRYDQFLETMGYQKK